MKKKLAILRNDPWLEPFAPAIEGRHEDVERKLEELKLSLIHISEPTRRSV